MYIRQLCSRLLHTSHRPISRSIHSLTCVPRIVDTAFASPDQLRRSMAASCMKQHQAFGSSNRRCFSNRRMMMFNNFSMMPSCMLASKGRDLASWAVNEYNKENETSLKFIEVQCVTSKLVAGKIFTITLEADDGGLIKVYEAKVWEKLWMDFRELREFKQIQPEIRVSADDQTSKDQYLNKFIRRK